jgi:heptosyltransferase I
LPPSRNWFKEYHHGEHDREGRNAVVGGLFDRPVKLPQNPRENFELGKGSSRLMAHSSSRVARLEPARVCIIKPSSLGDVIHSLPILAALRERWPSSHITWLVNRSYQDVLLNHRHLNELIVYDRAGRGGDSGGLVGTARLLSTLRRGRYDLTIDLQGLLRSAIMTMATMARVRVGLADAREGARWFYTDLVDASRLRMHAVDRVIQVARYVGATVDEPRFDLPIGEADRRWAVVTLAQVASPRIVLNLGARWLTKRWPPENFAAIARRAVSEFGAGLIVVGSRDDRLIVDTLLRLVAPLPVLDLCGRTGLLQLAALTVESDLVISNDTGPLHLAAAAGARVLGIYTCTDPVLTGPYGSRASIVKSCVWCAPSFIKRCSRLECMTELTPDRIWPAVKDQIESAMATTPTNRVPRLVEMDALGLIPRRLPAFDDHSVT